jgi:class II lanthipeptide synthase
METCRQQIAAVLRAVTFHSPTRYSWSGKPIPRLPRPVLDALSPSEARSYLLSTLQTQLYNDFYCQGGLSVNRTESRLPRLRAQSYTFTQALSAANAGSGTWEAGWVVHAVTGGQVRVERNGLALYLPYRPQVEEAPERALPAGPLQLRLPKEFHSLSPGFYFALGDRPFSEEASPNLLRLYWNLTPPGAVRWIGLVTARLNPAGLPFKCKVLNDPEAYLRCDAGVLYIRREDYQPVAGLLEAVYPKIRPALKPLTPVFTKPLADGLGLAEDPGQGESLGMQRCRIVAEGMLRAHEQGLRTVTESLPVVEACFLEEGIRLDEPFLNPGSRDVYAFHPGPAAARPTGTIPLDIHSSAGDDNFLRTAAQIGKSLAEQAIWYQQYCNWLGPRLVAGEINEGRMANAYGALGPDLYAGTSGVALFLGELYHCTGDRQIYRTALGAIQQALSQLGNVPPADRLGFHVGWMGIVLAAARLSDLLEQPGLAEKARRLLHDTSRASAELGGFDILAGRAGAIAVCLVLHDVWQDADPLTFAIRLGDELIERAVPSVAGISWKTPAVRHMHNLTGFSHGSAGAGYALFELFSITREERYREAALQAFDYERYWFDSRAANWPDFREPALSVRSGKYAFSFANAWCHGAPGIALSRMRAYELSRDPLCREEAVIALQTTRAVLDAYQRTGVGNFSLCHGLAGNAEVLLYGTQVLPADMDWSTAAYQAGIVGNQTYGMPGHEWPCGSPGGESPGLMIGLAGIGYFYLHLSGVRVPSVLMLRREEYERNSIR